MSENRERVSIRVTGSHDQNRLSLAVDIVAVFLTYQCRKKPTSLSMRIHRKGLDPMAAAMPMRVSIPLPIPVEGMLTTDFPLLFPKNDAPAAFHSYRSDRLPCRAQPQVVVLSPPEF